MTEFVWECLFLFVNGFWSFRWKVLALFELDAKKLKQNFRMPLWGDFAPQTTWNNIHGLFSWLSWKRMLRLSANLKAARHNENPDSPRSPQAPTAGAVDLHSTRPPRSSGYHSNSGYRRPAVSHRIVKRVGTAGCTRAPILDPRSVVLSHKCVCSQPRTMYHCGFPWCVSEKAFCCEQPCLFLCVFIRDQPSRL